MDEKMRIKLMIDELEKVTGGEMSNSLREVLDDMSKQDPLPIAYFIQAIYQLPSDSPLLEGTSKDEVITYLAKKISEERNKQ